MSWDEVRAEAFGEIGLLPEDFYSMDVDDYWLLHKGFFNKRVYEQRVIRRAVMTVIAPWVKNLPSPYSVFPLPDDDKLQAEIREYNQKRVVSVSQASLDRLRQFKEMERKQKEN